MSPFLDLPNELLLQVFYNLYSTTDACRLARTCSRIHNLFKDRKTKINILRFACKVPTKFSSDSKCVLSECVQIPPTKWWLRDKKDSLVTLTIDYSQLPDEVILKHIFRDMASIRNHRLAPDFQYPIHEFLSQFDNAYRRTEQYEHHTLMILKRAALHQKDILSEMSVIPEDLSSHDMVIALLLNCFVISDRIYTLCNVSSHVVPYDGEPYDIVLQHGSYQRDLGRCISFMAAQRQQPTSSLPESLPNTAWDLGGTLESGLRFAAQLLFDMMLQKEPRHFPKVLDALCIMCLVRDNVDFEYMDLISWQESFDLKPLVLDLFRLYYICSYGGQPFTRSFDREAYATLVGGDQIAIKHCDLLHGIWLDYDKATAATSGNAHLNSFGTIVHSLVCYSW